MKKWFSGIALGLALLASAGGTLAQRSDTATPPVAQTQSAQPAPSALSAQQRVPNVESVDILNQSQAERSRDQPGNAAPTWRSVVDGQNHYTSLPGTEMGVLIQPKAQFLGQSRATTAGEAWRQYRNGPLMQIGGWLIIGALVLLAAIYFIKGPMKLKQPRTGRLIERFTPLERITHWTVAISFVVLAITGLIMLFGKYVLLPLFGYTLFGWLAYFSKNVHNFVGPVFTLSTLVFIVVYIKDNFPNKTDVKWLKQMGGIAGKEHAHAGRFNGGEKLWFWIGVVVLGLVVSASGLVLNMLVPGIEYTRGTMQLANVIHLASAVLVAAMAMGHIYLGTVGSEGAYEGMRTGYVDDAWAKEHHDLWYEQVQRGEVPRVRTQPRDGDAGAPARTV